MNTKRSLLSVVSLLSTTALIQPLAACSSSRADGTERVEGQSDFVSSPMGGQNFGRGAEASDSAGSAAPSAASPKSGASAAASSTRKVEETDLYRIEGNRLYYLNGYRGLMVFDITDIDNPQFLGRSAIFGSPVEMIVRNGIATVVVADWYGHMEDNTPFHGSIVRGLDARDPKNITSLGEAKLGGWVRDTRVVGDVLYAVSEDYGWSYGWYEDGVASAGVGGSPQGPSVTVSSVSFANGQIAQKTQKKMDGTSGIFNVTSNAILVAHGTMTGTSGGVYGQSTGKSLLEYLDISDPAGVIASRGTFEVQGSVEGWGQDNGRWNLDFDGGKIAHVLTCADAYCGGASGNYRLSTVDFTQPDAPALASELLIPSAGYTVAARFDAGRMYLSPSEYGSDQGISTPVKIFDLSSPVAPKLAGQTQVPGSVWAFFPAGDRVFALGNDYGTNYSSSKVSLHYLDVTDAAHPTALGTASFGDGWAWTPAAGTFKAFARNVDQSVVALPFSGWSSKDQSYNNGVQLIEYTPNSIAAKGAGKSKGWVERGIFAKGRLLSLSDQALSIVDYADRNNPRVVKELTLARNIVDAIPNGSTVTALATDWWGNDNKQSELRVTTLADAEDDASGLGLAIEGTDAKMVRNGTFAYITTTVSVEVACDANSGFTGPSDGSGASGASGSAKCYSSSPQVQVVDMAGTTPVLLGKVRLPASQNSYGYGFGGCYWYDWYNGSESVQFAGSKLAFRQTSGHYVNGQYTAETTLQIVDASNPNAPTVASTQVTPSQDSWWGNMRAVGNTLYTTHYDWVQKPAASNPGEQNPNNVQYTVRYYLDRIDASNPSAPRIESSINVPGVLVGASETDPSILYFVDYRWTSQNQTINEFAAAKISGNHAYLQSVTSLAGYTGNVFVRGAKAYTTVERYPYLQGPDYTGPKTSLHELDLTNPKRPVDRAATEKSGWGWLLGVEGDRAIVTSGWGGDGIDLYRLSAQGAGPAFDQTVRTRGYYANSTSRQGNELFLSSGYWGVQRISLK